MSDDESKGLPDNPLGKVVFDKAKFTNYFLQNDSKSYNNLSEKAKKASLVEECGSRVHAWRVMLGLIPLENEPEKWIDQIKQQRKHYYTICDKYSIKNTKNLDPLMFNPLMKNTEDSLWNEMFDGKDIKDVIHKDVIRTYQEYEFFKVKEMREQVVATLYYWSKTYPMFSYRQGMNEIIAVLFFVFYAETAEISDTVDSLSSEKIAGDPDNLVSFLFNSKHTQCDIFIMFERIMSMGIKELYGTIDDISAIKSQLFGAKSNDKDRLFKWKHEIEQEEIERRKRIEKIYDDERKKSAVMRRCNRIYHTFLVSLTSHNIF